MITRYDSAPVEVLKNNGSGKLKVIISALNYEGNVVGYGDYEPVNQVPVSHKVGIKDDATYEGKYVCKEVPIVT